ncbi:MAG: SIR2 family protein [Spirochaetales bacterium]|nr:SIR2 family protein [Spirochaetales bacterium]
MKQIGDPLFLIGAGFNVDTALWNPQKKHSYPLVSDLLRICFNKKELPEGKSIEDLFQESIANNETGKLEILYDRIMEADYYIGGYFTNPYNDHSNKPYHMFLENFRDSHFLTFNYDSLLEMMLFMQKRWKPDDGFGIGVITDQKYLVKPIELPEKTSNLVLHLHGTLCVYQIEFYLEKDEKNKIEWIKHPEKPRYAFDPDSITDRFFPYRNLSQGPAYIHPRERVIAPVPDKAKDRDKEFIRSIEDKAISLIEKCNTLVAIGYSFSEHDFSSYQKLLNSFDKTLIIITPDADTIKTKLQKHFNFNIITLNYTFAEWASHGFVLP